MRAPGGGLRPRSLGLGTYLTRIRLQSRATMADDIVVVDCAAASDDSDDDAVSVPVYVSQVDMVMSDAIETVAVLSLIHISEPTRPY